MSTTTGRGRPWRRAIAGALVVLTTLGHTAIGTAWGQPADDDGTDEADPADEVVAANGLRLVDVPVAVSPGDSAVVQIVLPGVILDTDELIVTVHDPVSSVTDFERTITEQRFGSVLGSATYTLAELRPTAFGETAVRMLIDGGPPATDGADEGTGAEGDGSAVAADGEDTGATFTVPLRRPGVYPLTIDLRSEDQLLLGRLVTHLVRLPDGEVPKLPVVLGVDLHAVRPTARSAPDLSTVDTWLQALTAHPVPVTLGITPALVEYLARDTRLSTLRAIAAQGQVVDGPYERVDEAELSAEGLDVELDELAALGSQVLQSRLGVAPLDGAWLARDTVSARRLGVLAARGTATAVVPSAVVRSNGAEPATLGRALLPVGDRALTVLVSPSAMIDPLYDAADPRLATAHLLSYWSVLALSPSAPDEVAAWFPWNRALAPELLDGLLEDVTTSPLLTVTKLGDLPPPAATAPVLEFAGPPDQPDTLVEPLDDLRSAMSMLAGFRSMIADSDVGRSYLDLRATLLSSLGLDLAAEEQQLRWRSVQVGVRRETAVVEPPVIDSVRLAGRRGQLPLTFVNSAAYPVRIEVDFISDKVSFVGLANQRTTLQLLPGPNNLEFEVEARTAGTFPLEIAMTSPDGSLPLGSSRLTVRSLGAGNLGLLIAAAALAALGVWWILWVRSSRRQRPQEPAPGGADEAEWEDDAGRELVGHAER